jgi:phosphatidate cytidylyltransferase
VNESPAELASGGSSPWWRFYRAGILPRLLVILIGVPCIVGITLLGDIAFLLLVDVIILLGLREFYRLLQAKGYRPYKFLGSACAVALSVYVWRGGAGGPLVITLALMLIMSRELFRRQPRQGLVDIAVTTLGILYVGWLGSHLVMLRETGRGVPDSGHLGARLVLFAAAVTWAGDVMAYLVGVAFGRRAMAPRISPKKTVEGGVGGLAGSALAGWLSAVTFLPLLAPLLGAAVGLVAGFCGQVGDLVESMLKREAGLKDTAVLLPGHGGVLDRFDSLLFTAPLLYYFFHFFIL